MTSRLTILGRCSVICSRMIAAMATGTAMKKFQRQPNAVGHHAAEERAADGADGHDAAEADPCSGRAHAG